MKGPSLGAIRKFKQLQEEKKRLETEQKVKEKLITLEHRASRGDKKAKTQLKQIEKIEEEKNKAPELRKRSDLRPSSSKSGHAYANTISAGMGIKSSSSRPKSSGFDFDELMKLAANNTNEVKQDEKKEPPSKPQRTHERPRPSVVPRHREDPVVRQKQVPRDLPLTQTKTSITPKSSISVKMHSSASKVTSNQTPRPTYRHPIPDRPRPRPPQRREYHDDDYYDDDEDDYESDGFVVDDEDGQIGRAELDATLRSVFRYDRRQCDLREQRLDRLERAIGPVTTFEDLEREERRASRLAAAEDAAALRDLEERKRLKKQRLKGMRR